MDVPVAFPQPPPRGGSEVFRPTVSSTVLIFFVGCICARAVVETQSRNQLCRDREVSSLLFGYKVELVSLPEAASGCHSQRTIREEKPAGEIVELLFLESHRRREAVVPTLRLDGTFLTLIAVVSVLFRIPWVLFAYAHLACPTVAAAVHRGVARRQRRAVQLQGERRREGSTGSAPGRPSRARGRLPQRLRKGVSHRSLLPQFVAVVIGTGALLQF